MASIKSNTNNNSYENKPKYQLDIHEVINGEMSMSEAMDSLSCLYRFLDDSWNNRDVVLLDALNDVYDLSRSFFPDSAYAYLIKARLAYYLMLFEMFSELHRKDILGFDFPERDIIIKNISDLCKKDLDTSDALDPSSDMMKEIRCMLDADVLMSSVYIDLGIYNDALLYFGKAFWVLTKFNLFGPLRSFASRTCGHICSKLNRHYDALFFYNISYELNESLYGEDDYHCLNLKVDIVSSLRFVGDSYQLLKYCESLISVIDGDCKCKKSSISLMGYMGYICGQIGMNSRQLRYYEYAYAKSKKLFKDNLWTINCLDRIGRYYYNINDYKTALTLLIYVYDRYMDIYHDEEHSAVKNVKNLIDTSKQRMGDYFYSVDDTILIIDDIERRYEVQELDADSFINNIIDEDSTLGMLNLDKCELQSDIEMSEYQGDVIKCLVYSIDDCMILDSHDNDNGLADRIIETKFIESIKSDSLDAFVSYLTAI